MNGGIGWVCDHGFGAIRKHVVLCGEDYKGIGVGMLDEQLDWDIRLLKMQLFGVLLPCSNHRCLLSWGNSNA
jgi:hypothetical protein